MARKSKFFRVAVEGATTDGRQIERNWLVQIAKTYNQTKYGARIFVEHIRGLNPEWGFRCMGDVLAVKTDEVEIDGKKRLALFAQIAPTNEMVALNKAGQKIYSSIEVNPDFADSGEAYLVGLGITDSPASLGTEILAFAASNPDASPFSARKQHKDNLFSAAEPVEIEFEEEQTEGPSLFTRVKDLLKGKSATDAARFADVGQAVEEIAQATTDAAQGVADLAKQFGDLQKENSTYKADTDKAVADLKAKIDHTPNGDAPRPPASGGSGAVATDC